jgi:glycosyltransferase involved in cell wall biosynthesis
MKKISVMMPCYNEEENVEAIYQAVSDILKKECSEYDYEILFIDNCSTDSTRMILREICSKDKKVKAILNAKNFGQFNSPFYGLLQATGDCVIAMVSDFQDPVDMIPKYVQEWENGYKIVVGVKTNSEENKLVYFLRTCYYKFIKKFSEVDQIEHFTGAGLYDRSFIEVLRQIDDPKPFLRGLVAELGYNIKKIPYKQPKRRAGKTKNNWYTLYDAAMLSITSYTKIGLRLCTLFGFIIGILSGIIGLVYLIYKLIYWDSFIPGMAPVTIGMFLLGSIQLIFIGLLGEYIISINQRMMKRPLVIESERINFDEKNI